MAQEKRENYSKPKKQLIHLLDAKKSDCMAQENGEYKSWPKVKT